MAETLERSTLHVEGSDDKHALLHLLIRHGIDYDSEPWPAELPTFQPLKNIPGKSPGVESLLRTIETAVKLATGRVVGFVLDADAPFASRRQAVEDRLRKVGVDIFSRVEGQGFIGESTTFKSRVGVWIMPDNHHDGTIEHFLESLVAQGDPLHDHAHSATGHAKAVGAKFSEADFPKAKLHAWLAWQARPGLPYGAAIRAGFFQHESPLAKAFVAWFRELFRIAVS